MRRPSDSKRAGGLVLGACLILAACGGNEPAPQAAAVSQAPSRAPIPIVDLAGVDAQIAKHRGRALLVNFWAIWCQPCVEELPELMETAREFSSQGGDVVLVSFDSMVPNKGLDAVRADVEKFASRRKLEVPIVIYDAPDYDAIDARYDLPGGIPVTIAIDREGKIVDRETGKADKARFDAMMRKALGR